MSKHQPDIKEAWANLRWTPCWYLFPMVVSEQQWALICWDHQQIGAISASTWIFHLFAVILLVLKPWNVLKSLAAPKNVSGAYGRDVEPPHVALIAQNGRLLYPSIWFWFMKHRSNWSNDSCRSSMKHCSPIGQPRLFLSDGAAVGANVTTVTPHVSLIWKNERRCFGEGISVFAWSCGQWNRKLLPTRIITASSEGEGRRPVTPSL